MNGDAKTTENTPDSHDRSQSTFVLKGIKGHISTDSNRPHNDTVGNIIMPRLTSVHNNDEIDVCSIMTKLTSAQ